MLTAIEVKRLMDLLTKGQTNLNEAEKAELTSLQAKANGAAESAGKSAAGSDEGLSADETKKLIADGVKAGLADQKTVTADQVKSLVDAAVAGIKPGEKLDAKALTTDVVEQVKALIKPGVSAEDVKGIVETAFKAQRAASKMQFEGGNDPEIDTPIAHRSGNLTVAMKQLLNIMTGKTENDGITETQLSDANRRGERQEKSVLMNARKAITTTGAGTGLEWMNTSLSSQLLQRMYLESQVAQAFIASEVTMPTNPFNYPLGTTRPTFRLTGENATATASQSGSAGLALNAKKLVGIVDYSYEADEDAIIAILPKTIADLGDAAGEALEDAIINGDTAATHQDSDSHALGATHSGKMFDGIRKLVLAQAALKTSLATGGISAANILVLKKLLGRWGLNPRNLVLIAGVAGYNDLVGLAETLTAEKTGNAATARVLTGLAPNIYGIDIVPSAKMREDLNASGVYDGTTTTKGAISIVYKPAWLQGVRRGFTLETDVDKKAQTRSVIASFRRDFKPIEALTLTKAAVLGFNYTSGA
jgi:hypothetical protein